MATNKSPLRPLSLGRGVHRGTAAETMPPVSIRVPPRPVASDRLSETQGNKLTPAHPENRVSIALHVPTKQFASFSKWVTDHIRVVGPSGLEIDIVVLPELDGDVDFNQYGKPASLTIQKDGQQ